MIEVVVVVVVAAEAEILVAVVVVVVVVEEKDTASKGALGVYKHIYIYSWYAVGGGGVGD